MKKPITLNVNGTSYPLAVDPDEPLALVLRNRLGLMGVKVGLRPRAVRRVRGARGR